MTRVIVLILLIAIVIALYWPWIADLKKALDRSPDLRRQALLIWLPPLVILTCALEIWSVNRLFS